MHFLLLVTLSLAAEPQSLALDLTLPPLQPQPIVAGALLTDLIIGFGQAVSPYQISGPTMDSSGREGWQCLGVDNATLDVAARCPFAAMTSRAERLR
ncbi:MAG: hypothetical protein ACI8S6_002464 [Myxococcota bacterium]|jgi:hypothetical protein